MFFRNYIALSFGIFDYQIFSNKTLQTEQLKRTTKILNISSSDQIPSLHSIKEISRDITIKIIFEGAIQKEREIIGKKLKSELNGFQVSIHTIKPEINIARLITDEEIEIHQDFFENCAKDYRELGEKLIFKLAEKLETIINPDCPWVTFNELKRDKRQIGKIDEWRYYLHGFHCGFKNKKTGQLIEVPLVFSLEFGDLDPYFFSNYIKSTSSYRPLPVKIYEDYADGKRIIDKMLLIGKFEKINSNFGNHFGIVVTDRIKVEIKEFQVENKPKRKFNFWEFIGLKSKING